jgi:hypothetical protein
MKATGIAADTQYAHVWRLRNGLVTGSQQYVDTKQWADAASGGTALTRAELIGSLQNEVKILVHLAGKVDPAKLDYRRRRSSGHHRTAPVHDDGAGLVKRSRPGLRPGLDGAGEAAEAWISTRPSPRSSPVALYPALGRMSDTDFAQSGLLGEPAEGTWSTLLSGYAAYRTQLFLYLKACGREELSTWNLWVGMDEPAAA